MLYVYPQKRYDMLEILCCHKMLWGSLRLDWSVQGHYISVEYAAGSSLRVQMDLQLLFHAETKAGMDLQLLFHVETKAGNPVCVRRLGYVTWELYRAVMFAACVEFEHAQFLQHFVKVIFKLIFVRC